jgi:hypothetical protein
MKLIQQKRSIKPPKSVNFSYDSSLDALEDLDLFAEKNDRAKSFLQKAILPEKLKILSQ